MGPRDVLGRLIELLILGLTMTCAWNFQHMATDVHDLSSSVSALNERVAVVIEKVSSHERRIQVLESDR